ncbi:MULTISPECIES: LacI family DNA-binding transcriptional regulator [unclassified Rhizobium]|uniref:LacI family DNA-binding transcriptional regulator n=1 Tax=unclassified Rhizobium TaxID=2613769 RepID=UPI0007EBFBFC|nr:MULTISPECIES: LacI family DNA-binding transcriptional regulator [unclassified Rhizobium]ANM14470.1 LacI family transcriptional regulator protein [Rhizobium sp. N324]ANM20855.1 LacI family transcriptional regulator protein [Rhizobium sp. N541]ANM27234.1 LacI family transcriptional regulator protein [Rhizobium sp. N941]OWV85844.1 LacI family transcriptional regulator [Rhizobium sp. N122]OYC99571.1 LacI family transcriptional regulator protein [Rhizobium sp. N4311]
MTKPPTVRDVARLSGVSTATVSRYFGGKADAVAPHTIESVKKAAEILGYTPSEIGRSLRLARSSVVVMLVPDASNHFTADVAASLENALKSSGLSMVLANAAENAEQQDRLLADAQGLRAQAIVLQGAIDTPRLRELCSRQKNIIFVNRRPAEGIVAPYVGVDNFAAGMAVGQYFAERGYINCVAIHGPKSYSGSSERLDGFIAGLGDSGPVKKVEAAYTMEAGYEQGLKLLSKSKKRLSIFCGNDMIAYGVHRAAIELGLKIPDDVIMMGFDDNRLNDWLAPWLSTVTVPAFDYGPAIARLIEAPQEDYAAGSRIILPFSIKIRQSA